MPNTKNLPVLHNVQTDTGPTNRHGVLYPVKRLGAQRHSPARTHAHIYSRDQECLDIHLHFSITSQWHDA